MSGLRVRTGLREGARPPIAPWLAGTYAPPAAWPEVIKLVLAVGAVLLLSVGG